MTNHETPKVVIGRREWFCFPGLELGWVRGKIDTGARTSSLHAEEITSFSRDGETWVSFRTVHHLKCEAPVVFVRKVKSSNGYDSKRYFVELEAESLDGRKHDLLVSLTCRQAMKCPLLLGRRALTGFLVDCSRSQLLGKR